MLKKSKTIWNISNLQFYYLRLLIKFITFVSTIYEDVWVSMETVQGFAVVFNTEVFYLFYLYSNTFVMTPFIPSTILKNPLTTIHNH